MSFIKKNYEKVLLGAVLLGLVGSLLFLPYVIARDKQQQDDQKNSLTHPAVKPVKPVDMSLETNVLNRVQSTYGLDFETTNRLFNPMQWKKTPEGQWLEVKSGNEVGPGAFVVATIKPLYFVLKLDSVEPANQFSPARYVVSIQNQNAASPGMRNARQRYISVGEKNDVFSLTSVSGPASDPQLVLQINASGETVNLAKSKSFQEVDGYAADLKYPPLGKKWNDRRINDDLKIDTDDYIIVVIDQSEVVISAQSNQKKTTLKYQP